MTETIGNVPKYKLGDKVILINDSDSSFEKGTKGIIQTIDEDDTDLTYDVLWDNGEAEWTNETDIALQIPEADGEGNYW